MGSGVGHGVDEAVGRRCELRGGRWYYPPGRGIYCAVVVMRICWRLPERCHVWTKKVFRMRTELYVVWAMNWR